jgi:hypothetical protein
MTVQPAAAYRAVRIANKKIKVCGGNRYAYKDHIGMHRVPEP